VIGSNALPSSQVEQRISIFHERQHRLLIFWQLELATGANLASRSRIFSALSLVLQAIHPFIAIKRYTARLRVVWAYAAAIPIV